MVNVVLKTMQRLTDRAIYSTGEYLLVGSGAGTDCCGGAFCNEETEKVVMYLEEQHCLHPTL